MKSNIQIRIDTKMKMDFIRICEAQDKIPSKVVRSMIESYVMANTEMSLQNNICDDDTTMATSVNMDITGNDVAAYKTVTTKSGHTHHYAIKPLKVIKIANGEVVAEYKSNQTLKNKYLNKELFKIEVL